MKVEPLPDEPRDAFDLCGDQDTADRLVFVMVMLLCMYALVLP